jgi:hypothetical protein
MEKLVDELKIYMMTRDYNFEKKEDIDETFQKNGKFYRVNELDSLFWTLYILVNGFEKYESMLPTSFIREKDEKFKCIDVVRDPYSKTLLKEKQIKNSKNEIENNLANDEVITKKTFISLAILYKVDFLFFENKKVFRNGMLCKNVGDNMNMFIIFYDPETKECSIDLAFNKSEIAFLLEKSFHWENIEKPLKAITFYSYDELQALSLQLGYKSTDDRKDTKKNFYEYISKEIK